MFELIYYWRVCIKIYLFERIYGKYGRPIPKIYGTYRLEGSIIDPIKRTKVVVEKGTTP